MKFINNWCIIIKINQIYSILYKAQTRFGGRAHVQHELNAVALHFGDGEISVIWRPEALPLL